MTIDYQRAIEIIANAHKYKMKDIRKARKILDEMAVKADCWDGVVDLNGETGDAMKGWSTSMKEWAEHVWEVGDTFNQSVKESKRVEKELTNNDPK